MGKASRKGKHTLKTGKNAHTRVLQARSPAARAQLVCCRPYVIHAVTHGSHSPDTDTPPERPAGLHTPCCLCRTQHAPPPASNLLRRWPRRANTYSYSQVYVHTHVRMLGQTHARDTRGKEVCGAVFVSCQFQTTSPHGGGRKGINDSRKRKEVRLC